MKIGFWDKKVVHDNDANDTQRIINDKSPFAVKEAFKALYTNILYLNIEDKCRKIAITSAVSGEGKTFVSTNIAITLAQNSSDLKVLLIDTDMRQPRVSALLELDQSAHGLSEYLAGIDEKPNFIYVPDKKLTVLSAGANNVNPTKLIASKRMSDLLHACEGEFDYIIIDTPPVNIVSDAIILNENINGYILATRADYSDVKTVSEAVSRLNQINAEIYGIVLASMKLKTGGYGLLGGKYGKYGKYGRYGKYGKYGSE